MRMPYATEFFLAWRYLRSRQGFIKVITWFSFLGIVLGVATLVVVMAVMNGFRIELLGKIVGINGHVVVYGSDSIPESVLMRKIRQTEGVHLMVPFVRGDVLASSDTTSTGAMVKSMSVRDMERAPLLGRSFLSGSPRSLGKDGVAVGEGLAQQLHVRQGQSIVLISPHGSSTPFGVTPRIKRYTVRAIFRVGMSQYDDLLLLLPLRQGQEFFMTRGHVTGVEVFGHSPDEALVLARHLRENLEGCCRVVSWQGVNRTFFEAVETERQVMFLILSLILLVAAFNIISGLVMMVNDKTGDIAILRTIGATKISIMRLFFFIGSIIGFSGTCVGLLISLIICMNVDSVRHFFSWLSGKELFSSKVYFLSHIPARLEVNSVLFVIVLALVLSFLATLYPAFKASSLDPSKALRYES